MGAGRFQYVVGLVDEAQCCSYTLLPSSNWEFPVLGSLRGSRRLVLPWCGGGGGLPHRRPARQTADADIVDFPYERGAQTSFTGPVYAGC